MKMTSAEKLRRIAIKVRGLRQAMEAILSGTTPDHAKWQASGMFAMLYSTNYRDYVELTSNDDLPSIDYKRFMNPNDCVWPDLKAVFDLTYASILMFDEMLDQFRAAGISELSDLALFFGKNLRRAIHGKPEKEIDVQDAMESLLIGRGMSKPADYDREAGQNRSSGKDSRPDFIVPNSKVGIEVKLIKDASKRKTIIEQINADIVGYRPKWVNLLFVIYDIQSIQDIPEFIEGFERFQGVRVVVVKH